MTSQDLYRIRDFVPDFDAIASEFAERSRALSARTNVQANIPYGAGTREVLDLILPESPKAGAPLHVFVHGGYWRSGEKANYRFIAEPVLATGGIAAFVEYDLMPGRRLAVLVDQVRRSVLWLQARAREFGADPARLTVSGHSAGAHLASFLAAIGRDEIRPPQLPVLQGLLLLSGIYDLSEIPCSFLREEAEMIPAEAAAWSPLTAIQHPCPLRILAYGAEETTPFHEQALALHTLLRSKGQTAEMLPVPRLNHMSVVLDLANPDGILGRRLHDFVAGSAART
ncbi:lipase [Paramesorhizobium deserti]|uniref:Lipase n=1 Tax=Paramesorhizobium deserti TaxID=1494590 RepID=A0A135HY70_9HYPH|nr:alpha/beta hydrolase [Paramesorhizobium deserti]KXF78129.1 lipase [Paramesorhizobium deserti]